jgi:hypothetical protein
VGEPANVEVPHFAALFAIGRNGAAVVEQDSEDDKAACVYRVAVCPQGFREDLPDFGIPQLARKAVPLNLDALQATIELWEPRADLTVSQQIEALNEAVEIDIEVT